MTSSLYDGQIYMCVCLFVYAHTFLKTWIQRSEPGKKFGIVCFVTSDVVCQVSTHGCLKFTGQKLGGGHLHGEAIWTYMENAHRIIKMGGGHLHGDGCLLGTICDRIWEKGPLGAERQFLISHTALKYSSWASYCTLFCVSSCFHCWDMHIEIEICIAYICACATISAHSENRSSAQSGPFSQILTHIVIANLV